MARLERIIFVNFNRYTWSINPGNKAILDSHAGSIKAFCTPSLSLLAVAGSTPAGIEVSYVDEDFEAIDFDGGYDVAALSAMTQQAPRAYEVAAEFRRRGVHVVMGGIHASVLPDESLKHVDTVTWCPSRRPGAALMTASSAW